MKSTLITVLGLGLLCHFTVAVSIQSTCSCTRNFTLCGCSEVLELDSTDNDTASTNSNTVAQDFLALNKSILVIGILIIILIVVLIIVIIVIAIIFWKSAAKFHSKRLPNDNEEMQQPDRYSGLPNAKIASSSSSVEDLPKPKPNSTPAPAPKQKAAAPPSKQPSPALPKLDKSDANPKLLPQANSKPKPEQQPYVEDYYVIEDDSVDKFYTVAEE